MFESREEFREWLGKNHASHNGFWMVFGKTGLLKTLKPDEALEEALCFGWIDGQIKSIDQAKYVKKFTPRRKGSKWSEKNKKLVQALTESAKMTASGMAAVEMAKKDGQWNTQETGSISEEQVRDPDQRSVRCRPGTVQFHENARFGKKNLYGIVSGCEKGRNQDHTAGKDHRKAQ